MATVEMPLEDAEPKHWINWAAGLRQNKRWPVLDDPRANGPDLAARRRLAYRAIVAEWAGLSVTPGDAAKVGEKFLTNALDAPAYVVRAADCLLQEAMRSGDTTAEALYFAAAFAWPLRESAPTRSKAAWSYLIHAPWQADWSTLRELCERAAFPSHLTDGRSFVDLADEQEREGNDQAARSLLEGIASLQAGRRLVDFQEGMSFATKPVVPQAGAAVYRLARRYVRDGETAIHAREVVRYAAADNSGTDDLKDCLSTRVWNRPFDECHDFAKAVRNRQQLAQEIARALGAHQPDHATRLAEAVLNQRFNKTMIFGPAERHLPDALKNIATDLQLPLPTLLNDMVACTAIEHLATLYVRTNRITESARLFIAPVATCVHFVGAANPLHGLKREMQEFLARGNPFALLRHEEQEVEDARQHYTDDERRAAESVQDWFEKRFEGSQRKNFVDHAVRYLAAPISDAARVISSLPTFEGAIQNAIRMTLRAGEYVVGDLGTLRREGEGIRRAAGFGKTIMQRAEEEVRWERLIAAGGSTLAALVPKVIGPAAAAADLGATLALTYRAVRRVGALFNLPDDEESVLQYFGDALALGCSSEGAEGLLAYLSRPRRKVVENFAVGGIVYGAASLAGYLWTPQGLVGRAAYEQCVRHLARLLGMSACERNLLSITPLAGAVLNGIATHEFVGCVTDAAIHLAAHASLRKRALEA
jgi:hypothetical protein